MIKIVIGFGIGFCTATAIVMMRDIKEENKKDEDLNKLNRIVTQYLKTANKISGISKTQKGYIPDGVTIH